MKDCPDTEQLTVYLEHKLPPEEVAQFESHFIKCPTCRRIIAQVIKSESAIPEPIYSNKMPS